MVAYSSFLIRNEDESELLSQLHHHGARRLGPERKESGSPTLWCAKKTYHT